MAEQAVRETPPVEGVPRSLSDRALPYRWFVHSKRFMLGKPLGAFGVIIIALLIVAAAFADLLAPYGADDSFFGPNPEYDPELADQALDDPTVRLTNPSIVFEETVPLRAVTPTWEHPLGTTHQGRDLLSRIIYGSQLALLVGVGASAIAAFFGVVLGVISAYFAGLADIIIQRFVDSLQAFPALILLLLITQIVENPNKYWIMLALGVVGVAPVIRIVRSAVLVTREEQFVIAARVVGASDRRIMARHILPNIVAPIIVIFTISIGVYILAEATLSFLGFGDATAVSWGKMVNEGRQLGAGNPWMALFVGLALTITVLAFNLAGDALRDALDPRLRGGGGRPGF